MFYGLTVSPLLINWLIPDTKQATLYKCNFVTYQSLDLKLSIYSKISVIMIYIQELRNLREIKELCIYSGKMKMKLRNMLP